MGDAEVWSCCSGSGDGGRGADVALGAEGVVDGEHVHVLVETGGLGVDEEFEEGGLLGGRPLVCWGGGCAGGVLSRWG